MNGFEDLKALNKRLEKLLSDPHPGLAAWAEAKAECLAEIASYARPLEGLPGSAITAPHTPGPWRIACDGQGPCAVMHPTRPGVAIANLTLSSHPTNGYHELVTDEPHPCTDAYRGSTYKPERVANVRLISAAPELLEALKVVHECGAPEKVSLYDEEGIEGWEWVHPDGREWSEPGSWDEHPPMHPLARAAIAKAEGRAA